MATQTKEYITYNGITFRRYPESSNETVREYFRATPYTGASCMYLHREIWKHHHGSIPNGHVIHHVDGDKTNNDIENLVCIERPIHIAHHTKEWFAAPENKEWSNNHLAKIRPMTKKWHASEEGHIWHSNNAKTSLCAVPETLHICKFCGEEYMSVDHGNNKFCSNKCKSAWRRQSGVDDIDRICVVCGNTFRINKYSKAKTCTRECGGKLLSAVMKEKNRKV